MKYAIRPIVSNILLFIESLLIVLITLLFSLKFTILNEKSAIKQLKKTDYYEKVNNETKDTMKYITRKSGYKDYIVDDIYSIEDITNDINTFVKSIYNNTELKLNTEHLKENITNNLENYLKEKNKIITEQEKTEYMNKIVSTYKNEVRLMKELNNNSETISGYNKTLNFLIPLFIIDFIVILIINKKIYNKKEYHVLAFTSAISLIGINVFIKTLNIKSLFVYNNNVSEIIKRLIYKSQFIITIFILLYIIIGLVFYILDIKEEKEMKD